MTKTEAKEQVFDSALLKASREQALAKLGEAGARGDALIDAWVREGNADAVGAVAEATQGALRKTARRALNVLMARGIKPSPVTRVATVGGEREKESLEAWLLPPDGTGTSLLVLASRTPTTRYRALFAFVSRTLGVIDARTSELAQSQLRASIQGALRGAQYKPVSIPVAWAQARIAEARTRHRERGVPEPLGFAGAEGLLGEPPSATLPHPFDEEGLELGDEDQKTLIEASGSLHELPEFRGWLPNRPSIDELLAKVGEGLPDGEEPEPRVVEELLKNEVLAATDRYFSPERRADLVLSMKDSGLGVLARDGEVKALELVATIKGIERCGLITDPPHEIPFLRAFFEKAIGVLLAQGGGKLSIPRRAAAQAPAPTT